MLKEPGFELLKAQVNMSYHWGRSNPCWKVLPSTRFDFMLPQFKLVNKPGSLLKVRLKPCDCRSEPNGEKKKNLHSRGFFPNSSSTLFSKHTICVLLLFVSGGGSCWGWGGEWTACNNILFTFLVVMFVTVSVCCLGFFLLLVALKAPPYRNVGFRFLSEWDTLSCPDSVAKEMVMNNCVQWGDKW